MAEEEKKTSKTAASKATPKMAPAKKTAPKSAAKKVEEKKTAPKAAAKKAPAKKTAAKKTPAGKTVTVTQIGSPIGRKGYQRATLIGLGLNKMNRTNTLEDTASIRGMINKVSHLIKIEEDAA